MFDIIKIFIDLNFLYIFLDKKIYWSNWYIYMYLLYIGKKYEYVIFFYILVYICMKRGNGSL